MARFVSSEKCEERSKWIEEKLTEMHSDIKEIKENHIPHLKIEMAKIAVMVGGVVAVVSFIANWVI